MEFHGDGVGPRRSAAKQFCRSVVNSGHVDRRSPGPMYSGAPRSGENFFAGREIKTFSVESRKSPRHAKK